MRRRPLNKREREIVESNIGLCYKFASRFTLNRRDQILSECFVALCYAAQQWDGIRPLSTFVWRKFRARAGQLFRREKKLLPLMVDVPYTENPHLDDVDEVEFLLRHERDRELLRLRYMEGRTLKEVGNVYRQTKESARIRIDAALRRVRK